MPRGASIDADRLLAARARTRRRSVALQVGVVEQVPDDLDGVEQLDHPRPVVAHRDVVGPALGQRQEFLARRLGLRRVDEACRC